MAEIIMRLIPDQMSKMIDGTKTVELRLNDSKRRKINVNDVIVFESTIGKEKLKIKVFDRLEYETFEELYKDFTAVEMGYNESELANPDDMLKIYSKENILKFGVVGFLFEIINDLD